MMSYHCSLFGMLLIASASVAAVTGAHAAEIALPATSGEASYKVAQLFEPNDRRPRREAYRAYFDEYGRKITVDRRGRVISVEEPQNDQSSDYFPDAPQDPYDTGAIPEDPYARPNDPYEQKPALPSERDYGGVDRQPLPPADGESNLQSPDPNYVDPGLPGDGLTDAPQQEQI